MSAVPGREFFARNAHEAAAELLGAVLLVDGVGGRIVEVEIYEQGDPASHSYRGRTARNASMFGPPGNAYVYRSYGLHWCMNLVCEPEGVASAILLRALEPTAGLDRMRERRGLDDPRLLCAGPGRLCQALGITGDHDGAALDRPPFAIRVGEPVAKVARASRIGIREAREQPWRLCDPASRYLSRALPRAR